MTIVLGACVPPPPEEPPVTLGAARRLEESVTPTRVQASPQQALDDLEAAVALYSLVDEQVGQVRVHLKLVRLYFRLGREEDARRHLAAALPVARRSGDADGLFEALLLRGRLSGEAADYQAALAAASRPLHRALALTYLGHYEAAYRALLPVLDQADGAPDDYAYVLYEYARATDTESAGRQALALFKEADNHQGIADALFVLGRTHARAGRARQARAYLERARTVALALQNAERVRRIDAALTELAGP